MIVVVVGWQGSQEVLLSSCIHNILVTLKLDLHFEILSYSVHSKSIIGKHYNSKMNNALSVLYMAQFISTMKVHNQA